jgi:hypothetical protein
MATTIPRKFTLEVPLDASKVEDFKPQAPVKVALVNNAGKTQASVLVKLDAKGRGLASFGFEKAPAALRVVVGPGSASDLDIVGLDTLSVPLPTARWKEPQLKLRPIIITPYYWRWWLRWCRIFTIDGRVLCADGKPVPGANVCAFDVDAWWWWSSFQQVGCATTDANGEFQIRFRWCCGWLPWWWWRLRDWRLDDDLAERLRKLLGDRPQFERVPRPQPQPDPAIFDRLLGRAGPAPTNAPAKPVDPARVAVLRESLLKRLPRPADSQLLAVWPWAPFEPWNDCTPDIALRVTQNCAGEERLIVNERWWDTRWNIDTTLSVKLEANSLACCAQDVPEPPQDCAVPFSVCGVQSLDIGGNLGAPATPAGFANPGDLSVVADAPWAGMLRIGGDVGTDYYEFEIGPTAAGPWTPVSPLSAGGFSRLYWDSTIPGFQGAAFPFQSISGRNVCESRAHYEATHFPGTWGTGNPRIWLGSEFDTLMLWYTANHYNNGKHHLRLVGYEESGGNLSATGKVLEVCGTQAPNALVVHLDNRLPATLEREPRADVVSVRIGGIEAGPCSNVQVRPTDGLEIDFIAYDVDAHLSEYTLAATYGKNLAVNLLGLLALPGVTLTGIALDGEPAAVQVGPTYPAALAQGAARPVWAGGGLRLTVPAALLKQAFPITCCYQIELWALKRTIADCDGSRPHRAFSFYSLTVNV